MLIGEVARRSGVSARMLRHYESLGLVRPSGRTGSGYREYSQDDIRRIFHIESLRSLGLSLREIGRALDEPGFAPSALVEDLVRRTRERIAAETELLTRLRRIDAASPAGWEDVLQVVALLQALGSKSADARQRAALSSAHEAAVPVEALVEAVLSEADHNVAGTLRWALARAGDEPAALLAEGLASPVPAVRERAVKALAELPGDEAAAQLRHALDSPDAVVRGHAAPALGSRGVSDAVPTLIDMVVEGRNDTDAADALSVLAADATTADRIANALVGRIAHDSTGAPARGRLTQALAGIPGERASGALVELTEDEDRAVALTATYLLRLREAGDVPAEKASTGSCAPGTIADRDEQRTVEP
ncbi:MerR family transcriptional regulator [Streptomyces sp. R1]|uniref:MerR family transcriptional regulator n=1 Tax=unclassified Streptomyces TaxID=2593676 RepID=UPI001E3B1110|nr:MerR family transcriptional regulator [Streptomyces sp. R1]MCC8338146.1 MerR family transcriptional regulator [Streptomyces sp. R1]MDA4888045.1 MerR family transcriptional regulator [Streptomyces sp. MS2A]